MSISIIWYIFGFFFFACRRVISGMKNGIIYGGKGSLKPFKENLHRLETVTWYVNYTAMFCFTMAFLELVCVSFVHAVLFAVLLCWANSALSSPFRQGFINVGSGRPFTDPEENTKQEFIIRFRGKDFGFWFPRPWYGWRRYVFAFLGSLVGAYAVHLINTSC